MPVTLGRERLAQVLRMAGDLIKVDDTVKALGLDRRTAAKLMSRWNEQGLLRRIRRGVYAPVPMHALSQVQVLEDPWVLVPELFDPAYIGGWTAAEHWDLTEQLFRSVCVLTLCPVTRKHQTIQGLPFVVKHVRQAAFFGTVTLWRGRAKIQIADPHKTIVDMLDDPSLGGSMPHVASCVRHYLSSEARNEDTLLAYARRMRNGAILKRLGFLAEYIYEEEDLAQACATRLTTGNAKLDPALPSSRLVTKWRLWVPDGWRSILTDD